MRSIVAENPGGLNAFKNMRPSGQSSTEVRLYYSGRTVFASGMLVISLRDTHLVSSRNQLYIAAAVVEDTL